MAWPKSLENISTNMTTTELWVLKERMTTKSWQVVESTGFAEFSKFTIEFENTGERYEFEEFVEMIDKVTRL